VGIGSSRTKKTSSRHVLRRDALTDSVGGHVSNSGRDLVVAGARHHLVADGVAHAPAKAPARPFLLIRGVVAAGTWSHADSCLIALAMADSK